MSEITVVVMVVLLDQGLFWRSAILRIQKELENSDKVS